MNDQIQMLAGLCKGLAMPFQESRVSTWISVYILGWQFFMRGIHVGVYEGSAAVHHMSCGLNS